LRRIVTRRSNFARAVVLTALLLVGAMLAELASRPGIAAGRVRRPILLRIEGVLDAAPEGIRPLRTIEVRIGKQKTASLAVTKIVNQGEGPLGPTILDEVARYKPAFRLQGDAALVAKLASAPPGTRVTFFGNLTSGRHLLLSSADVAASTPP
jgi:hypothetical protein